MSQSKEILKLKEESKKAFDEGKSESKKLIEAHVHEIDQLKSAVQNLEDFIEMAKITQRMLEEENISKD